MSETSRFHLQVSLARTGFSLNVDLDLPGSGITVLFGPSGSGKTTLLRCVAGLESATGCIAIDSEVWLDSARGISKPTWQREIGYVFQEASLFDHLNVRQNLLFGLQRAGGGRDIRALDDVLNLLGIEGLLNRTVNSLSGGERQRIAIARAMATRPRLLLLDEPLAALDVARRQDVLPWLERLHAALQMPMLYVTHSVEEMARLADHVAVLGSGQVMACGPLAQVMASSQMAWSIGEEAGVVAIGDIIERDASDHLVKIRFGGGTLWARDQGMNIGDPVRIRILARDVSLSLSPAQDTSILNHIPGIVETIDADVHPSHVIAQVRCGSECLLVRVTRRSADRLHLAVGLAVWCQVKSVALMT